MGVHNVPRKFNPEELAEDGKVRAITIMTDNMLKFTIELQICEKMGKQEKCTVIAVTAFSQDVRARLDSGN